MSSLVLNACSQAEMRTQAKEIACTQPMIADTMLTKSYVCQIKASQHIELRALEKGYLKEILVDEGQFVQQGQLMFTLNPSLYEADLERAQAETKLAEIEYENTQTLFKKGIVSINEVSMMKAKYDKARAEQKVASSHLAFSQIRAPFSGIMDRLLVRKGSLVEEGELLTTLSDNDKMWVYFNVPESEYLDFKMQGETTSTPVKLILANGRTYEELGKIEAIEADFNNETGNIAFRATFSNPRRLLRHGETGTVQLPKLVSNAILIPQKATYQVLEKRFIWIVDKNNRVSSREINVSAEMPDLFVIDKGIQANELIILEGIRKVREGDSIIPRKISKQSVYSNLRLYSE